MWLRTARQVLGVRFWLRVSAASAAIFVVLVGLAKWAFPLLPVGDLWKAVVVIPGMFAYLAIMIGLHIALPKFVKVRKDRVLIHHGQTPTMIKADEIQSTRLVFFGDGRAVMRITYCQKDRRRSLNVAVKPGVDLKKLVELLPVPPRVSDLRVPPSRERQ